MAHRPTATQKELEDVLTYFNNQPDMLTAIVKHRTSTRGHLGDVLIQSFDPEGKFATLELRPPPAWSTPVTLELPFDPPLTSAWHVRPTLKRWRDEAYAKYNVPATPPLTYYSSPTLLPLALPALVGLAVLAFALYGTGETARAFRAWVDGTLGNLALPAAKWTAIAFHLVLEPIYMLVLTARHGTPSAVRAQWVLTVVLVGFAGITEFWDCLQYERIRHIYKQTDVGDIGHRLAGPYVVPGAKGKGTGGPAKAAAAAKKAQ
ncbi:hypothetical protein Q5752_005095 [Cryptotrichosporon argae]